MNNKRDALYPGYVVPAGAARQGGITSEENGAGDLTDEQIDSHIIKSGVMDKEWPTQVALHSFARDVERAAIAAHLARQPKAEQSVIKTWQERMPEHVRQLGTAASEAPYKDAEIADLRAAFARQAQAVVEAVEHAARICESHCVCDNGEDDEDVNWVLRNRAAQIRGLLGAPVAPASAQNADELRRAVREMTSALDEHEWAEHVSSDPDAAALEHQITLLVGQHNRLLGAAKANAQNAEAIRNQAATEVRSYDRKDVSRVYNVARMCTHDVPDEALDDMRDVLLAALQSGTATSQEGGAA